MLHLRLFLDRSIELDTRCLAKKLLTYALGREIEFGDRRVVDSMLAELGDGGLKDLVKAVVFSESFGKNWLSLC